MKLFSFLKKKRPKTLIPERPLPDFLVIGVQKGGTSWLWDQLRQHPDIWLPPFKELQFFNHEFIPSHRSWTTKHCDRAIDVLRGKFEKFTNARRKRIWETYLAGISQDPKPSLEWYRNCFTFPVPVGSKLGDVSPAYCTIPDEGVDYVKDLLPDVKIIMIVRNPLKRMVSHLRMRMSGSKNNFSTMVPAQWHGYVDGMDLYQRAAYSEYIPRWDERFGDNILYLPFDLIRENPAEFLGKVTKHLGVTEFVPLEADKPVHVTEKHPIPEPIIKLLTERTEAEWAYLQKRFPAEFVKLCRY